MKSGDIMKMIYDYSYLEMEEMFVEKKIKKFRAKQLFTWLYRKRVQQFTEMTDLSKDTIAMLQQEYIIDPVEIVETQIARDKTTKYLFKLQDGALVEAVLMYFDYGNSLCVSSQIGCNMGCRFCASGLLKKCRDCTSGEMVGQVMAVQRMLDETDQRLSHVVIMGTGEPFDNYEQVMRFCKTINDDRGLAIGARHITISTCGIVPKIDLFAKEKVQYNLAVSLHAPDDDLRNQLMPINQAYPLSELMASLRRYSEDNHRRLTFEYILLKGVNDSEQHARQLAKLLRNFNAYVNLIPYNPVDEHGFQTSLDHITLRFYDTLMKNHVKCTLRQKHGEDIDAACGQLRAKHEGS